MVNTFQQVFRAINNYPGTGLVNRHLPMINKITTSYSSYLLSVSQLRKKKALMSWYKQMPELTALTNKVAKDIVYKFHFEPVNSNESGRNKIMRVNKFTQEIRLRSTMFSQVIDGLITGEAFGWIGKLTDKQLKEKISVIVGKRCWGMERKEKDWFSDRFYTEVKAEEGFADTSFIDEDLLRPRKYRSIASSTIEIVHDEYDINFYNHVVNMRQEKFMPKEIIHFPFLNVDGKPNGFTPVESVLVQLELLRQMWQNQLSLHKNGGAPDKVFILKNIKVSDPSYKRIEEQLQKYKIVENKHGNMLFTGDVAIEDLQQLDGMQFKEQGLYITGLLAMQWQIPRSSIPFIIGGTNTKDDTGGNSEKGYWRNIEFMQSIFAETMNTQLWIPHFGVRIVFDNTFPQQDVQLQTALGLRLTNIRAMDDILAKSDRQLNKAKRFRMLGITDEDTEKAKELDWVKNIMDPTGFAQGGKNQLGNSQINNSDDKNNVANAKRTEQNNVISSRGMKPTGVGKELKEISGDRMRLDLNTFLKIYNEDKALHFDAPRLFIKENEDFTSLIFKSTDLVYHTVVPTPELSAINMMRLSGGKIYKL